VPLVRGEDKALKHQTNLYKQYISRVKKVKQSVYRPGEALRSSRRLKLPEFLDNRHMKVAMLSALSTGRLYHSRRYPWYSFLL
jgi:hypothetical protein